MPKPNRIPEPAAAHRTCCHVTSFREKGCRVVLPKPTDEALICISGTEYQKHHKANGRLCDLSIFWCRDPDRVAMAIELKSGNFDANHVRDQLQSGADLLASLSSGCASVKFFPVLTHSGLRTFQVRTLDRVRITFGGTRYKVTLQRCGMSVESLAGQA